MTRREWEMVQALKGCVFQPASWDKRMVRSYPDKKTTPLSAAQKAWLPALHYKYRRQTMPGESWK